MDGTDDEVSEERRIERVMQEVAEDFDRPAETELHPDRQRHFSSMGFARMRTRWTREEDGVIEAAKAQADHEILRDFKDVYIILNDMYEIVREPLRNPDTGVEIRDEYGFCRWKTGPTGQIIEDWSKLTEADKENFLHKLTTRLVMWEQRAVDYWMEAMMSKAVWEERFATTFTSAPQVEGKRPTEADRREHAQVSSREQRYFALFMSARSKKAEALVRSAERLSQRLKDTSR